MGTKVPSSSPVLNMKFWKTDLLFLDLSFIIHNKSAYVRVFLKLSLEINYEKQKNQILHLQCRITVEVHSKNKCLHCIYTSMHLCIHESKNFLEGVCSYNDAKKSQMWSCYIFHRTSNAVAQIMVHRSVCMRVSCYMSLNGKHNEEERQRAKIFNKQGLEVC